MKEVDEKGVAITSTGDDKSFTTYNIDMSFPFVIVTLCLSGSARAVYDMQEYTQNKNDIGILLPGHIMRPLECSVDYTYTRIAISQKMLADLRSQLFNHNYIKYNHAPLFSLTDTQVKRLLSIVETLKLIASHSELDLHRRNHILTAQMVVGYEFINYYRKQQEKLSIADSKTRIFAQFCELVAEHYRESREIIFYAELMDLHPKYLCRVINQATHGITPKDWMERYVVAQAKRIIAIYPDKSLKNIAYQLGFNEATSFNRYFKRVEGITPKDYRDRL